MTITNLLDLPFEVGSKAKVRGQDLTVTVRNVRWDGHEIDYWVTWWDEGARKDAWLRPDELEKS